MTTTGYPTVSNWTARSVFGQRPALRAWARFSAIEHDFLPVKNPESNEPGRAFRVEGDFPILQKYWYLHLLSPRSREVGPGRELAEVCPAGSPSLPIALSPKNRERISIPSKEGQFVDLRPVETPMLKASI